MFSRLEHLHAGKILPQCLQPNVRVTGSTSDGPRPGGLLFQAQRGQLEYLWEMGVLPSPISLTWKSPSRNWVPCIEMGRGGWSTKHRRLQAGTVRLNCSNSVPGKSGPIPRIPQFLVSLVPSCSGGWGRMTLNSRTPGLQSKVNSRLGNLVSTCHKIKMLKIKRFCDRTFV